MTDRRTDGGTELRWLGRAESIAAFACNKTITFPLTTTTVCSEKKHPLTFSFFYLHDKCLDFHKMFKGMFRKNQYSAGKKVECFATSDVIFPCL